MVNNNSVKIELQREFNCGKDALYNAWTNQRDLQQWWHPLGKTLSAIENDMREGGKVRYIFEDESLVIDGEYLSVEPSELLKYTWNWHLDSEAIHDTSYTLTVRFKGDQQNSILHIEQSGFHAEESIQPHQHGWEQALNDLENYLNQMTGTGEKAQQTSDAGYNELPEQQKVGGG